VEQLTAVSDAPFGGEEPTSADAHDRRRTQHGSGRSGGRGHRPRGAPGYSLLYPGRPGYGIDLPQPAAYRRIMITDHGRSSEHREAPVPGPSAPQRRSMRPLLWTLLAISVTANGITSTTSLPPAVGIAFGLLALVLGAVLIRDHYRARRRATPVGSGRTSRRRPGA
jgi:hypothetical protein